MTLAITYLLAVVSAVVSRRSLAVRVSALGDTAAGIVIGGWTGDRFEPAFVQQLVGLSADLSAAAEQHLAYPVLHYFHSPTPESAAPLALARLDDALLLLRAAIAPAVRPDRSALEPARRAMDRYLAATGLTFAGRRRNRPAAAPDTAPLGAAGIPLAPAGDYLAYVEGQADRRGRLRDVVLSDGWSWPAS